MRERYFGYQGEIVALKQDGSYEGHLVCIRLDIIPNNRYNHDVWFKDNQVESIAHPLDVFKELLLK